MTENAGEPEENIDKTQWLPDGEAIVTPERLAKGDMRIERRENGEIRFAQAQINSIMNFLEAGNILNAQHVHDGQTYEIWQICFSAHVGYRNNPIYSVEIRGLCSALAADQLDVGEFETLLRALSVRQKNIIESALKPGVTDHMRWLAMRNKKGYQDAFDRLTDVMQRLREGREARQREKSCNE